MTQFRIHGEWTISFKNRIVYSKVIGATNEEASQAWLKELKGKLQSSPVGCSEPWVVLHDLRNWGTATLDTWESANENIHWILKNNCVLFTIVFSKELQKFVLNKGLKDQNIVRLFFDYDAAYQACLDKLAEAQNKNNK